MYKNIGLIFFGVVLIAAAVAIYVSIKQATDNPTPGPMDISLDKLRTRNPGLTFSMVSRAHAFWVTDPKSGNTVIVPWQQTEDALIEFIPCKTSDIPDKMLYPRRSSEPVCLRITNEDGILSAFYFRTTDSLMYDITAFYDGPSKNTGISGSSHEQTGRHGTLPDGTSGFLYSYFFHMNPHGNAVPAGVVAFVGYKKEKRTQ